MIQKVKIVHDDNVSKCMDGIIRDGFMITIDGNGNDEIHEELITQSIILAYELIKDIS